MEGDSYQLRPYLLGATHLAVAATVVRPPSPRSPWGPVPGVWMTGENIEAYRQPFWNILTL